MISVSEGSASAESALRLVLDQSLGAADSRPMAEVLRAVARSLVELAGCTCAAISVGTPDGRLECFVTGGDEALADSLFGPPNSANDPISDVVTEAVVVREPAGTRFGGTPVEGRIGVPIILRGRAAGGCYLGGPPGREEFVDGELALLQLAAQGVATVIEKARTAAANRQREAWYENGVALAREIVAGGADPLRLIIERAAAVADASVASIIVPGPDEHTVVVAASTGTAAEEWQGTAFTVPASVGAATMFSGRPQNIAHIREAPLPRRWSTRLGVGAALALPLAGSGTQHGVLLIARPEGAPQFAAAEMSMAAMFAGTVSLALELSQSQTLRDQLALVAERDRIARDLHDHVIQRLYAVGLSLESASSSLAEPAAEQLIRSVDEIDETIKQIRATIFRLTTPILSVSSSLRSRAEALVDELVPALGFRPGLTFTGPIDFAVEPDLVDDCVAVLREAVTNVARHAQASHAEVSVAVTSNEIRLEIADNGRGLGATSRRSGIANMRARAEGRGGFMQVRTAPGEGTALLWSVPLDTPA